MQLELSTPKIAVCEGQGNSTSHSHQSSVGVLAGDPDLKEEVRRVGRGKLERGLV